MASDDETLLGAVQDVLRAMQLVEAGRHADAKRLLLSVREILGDWPQDVLGFQALRALARCYRAERDFDAAREACLGALDIAKAIGEPSAAAIALEGLALIEMENGHVSAAAGYFAATASLEGRVGNFEGRAAALGNYANMLLNRDVEGAEPLLREALKSIDVGSRYYPAAVDNLAAELQRQGRYLEAVEYGEAAIAGFLASDRPHDAFISLRTLSRALAAIGRIPESAEAFRRAHDLIRDLRRSEIDEDHYAKYPERVSAIEAKSKDMLKDQSGRVPDEWLQILAEKQMQADKVDLIVGAHAYLGNEATQRAFEQLEAGQYAAAIESLIEARSYWQGLNAVHMLVSIDYHMAVAFTEIGDVEKALPMIFGARAVAHELGDADREQMALTLIARLTAWLPATYDSLDYLMRARALEPCKKRQKGIPDDIDMPIAAGVLAGMLAAECVKAHEYDLAESYYDETLRVARAAPDVLQHRLIYRLGNYYNMLIRAQRNDRAAEILAELRSAAAAMSADPRISRVLARTNSRGAFYRGERTQEVLNGLLGECRAYEEERGRAQGLDLSGFAHALDPPYEEAVEVALALDDLPLGLGLLELGKARTLVEAVDTVGPGPRLGESAPAPPAIGRDLGISLFVSGRTIVLLRLDGASGKLTQARIEDDTETGQALPRAVRDFVYAADSERAGPVNTDALDTVLAHPTFRRLADSIAGAIPAGQKAWLVPHSYLHYAPLQLLKLSTGTAARYSIAPSLSVAGALPRTRLAQGRADIVACGDSLDDLPFARAEARLVAGTRGSVAVGEQCTPDWLRASLTPATGILHIACHGRFDLARPARSGLLLAAPREDQLTGTTAAHMLTLPEVARLPLDGMIIVLSACSSGMESVRTGDETRGLVSALLAARAATVIAAQWPVGDLDAMLLMIRFYRRLAEQGTSADLLATLDAASADVRDLTAADLIDTGFEVGGQVLGLGGTPAEAARLVGLCLSYAWVILGDEESARIVADAGDSPGAGDDFAALRALRPSPTRAAAVRPFAHPWHWGAFKVVGRDTTLPEHR